MPLSQFPKTDTELVIPQEQMRAGVIPPDQGQTALNVLYGTLVDTRDPNQSTQSLSNKINTYRKMQADPTVGGALQGYENILSLVSWDTVPADPEKIGAKPEGWDEKKSKEVRDFVASCFDDMNSSIEDNISSALDMLAIGFQVTVPQFKIRGGSTEDPRTNSKYNDGRIGWKYWKSIHQESIDRWLLKDGDGYEDLTGLRQIKVNGGYETIPRNRMLLFRTTTKGGNMEGESILYSAVSTWEQLQKTLATEAVSLSRNLEGIPVLKIASRYLSENATADEKKLRDFLIRQVKSIKYNDQTALVLPSDVDAESKVPIIDISLMTAGPNVRVDQCRQVASAQEQLIAESILANFMKLGSGGGSYAMSSSMQDMFVLAMKKYLDNIASVINNEAIPALLKLNGMDPMYAPCLVHEGLETESVGVFVDALVKSVQSGVIVPTKELQRTVLTKLRAPVAGADEAWKETAELQKELMEATRKQAEVAGQPNPKQTQGANQQKGTETSPEKVSKNKEPEVYEVQGQYYQYRNGQLVKM
ncbi:MAG: hypothetical protein HRU21_09360 [Pseudomonadales bacterium]|nr:hypothetical protein [Pseudomonadales bacterium]